jgi:hypothetical protein
MTETRWSNLGGPLFVAGAVIMIVGLLSAAATAEADWASAFVDSLER